MKKLSLLVFIIVVICLIGCFACNTGGKNIQTSISEGIEIFIESGEHWLGKMKVFIFSVKKTPQLAVWIEDNHGNYISTITATKKSVTNNWIGAEGRIEALPVWNYKRQNSTEQVDIVSSATPKGSVKIFVDNNLLINGQEYNVYLEINHSFDYNDYWTEGNSGVNGQPSLIFYAKFTAGNAERIKFDLIGHGSVDGSNGDIVKESDSITTALTIINNAYIIIN